MRYTKQTLLDNLNNPTTDQTFPTYLGFWGKRGTTQREEVFSNFHLQPFEMEVRTSKGVSTHEFTCNEQYFMYRKAEVFNDQQAIERILQNGLTPQEYKQFGREVRNYDDKQWGKVRFEAMLDGLRGKFTQNEDLKQILLNTNDAILVEASPRDRIWGIGLSTSNPNWTVPQNWRGRNLLGFALMEIRDELNGIH